MLIPHLVSNTSDTGLNESILFLIFGLLSLFIGFPLLGVILCVCELIYDLFLLIIKEIFMSIKYFKES